MEACYAEVSKSRGDAVPQIYFRSFAHQNCIGREPIVDPTRDDSGQFPFGIDTCRTNAGPQTMKNPACEAVRREEEEDWGR